jgi:hypothetical protein
MNELDEEIRKYVKYFRKKRDLDSLNTEEINKVLISEKYFEFIDNVYKYFNHKNGVGTEASKERLAIECYLDADEAINQFWSKLLGSNNLTDAVRAQLKIN